MSANPQPFTSDTLNKIQSGSADINQIANIISSVSGVQISGAEIAAPIAREMNKTQIDYPPAIITDNLKALSPFCSVQTIS
jgi:hypothetical protein